MIDVIEFEGESYPAFQSKGNASKYAIPFAEELCSGFGYDIGCMKKEWSFPGSHPIDIDFDDDYDANNLPDGEADYIFSSHCLEHIDGWVDTMDYWYSKLNDGGVLFLYLPDFSQKYWRPWNNRKHRNVFTPDIIRNYMVNRGYKNVFVSGVDLNNSFIACGEK